jgi:hypothetical protein
MRNYDRNPRAGHGRGMPRVGDKYEPRAVEMSASDLNFIYVAPNEWLIDADGAILVWSA